MVLLIGCQLSGLQIIANVGTHSGMQNFSTKTQFLGGFIKFCRSRVQISAESPSAILRRKTGGQKTKQSKYEEKTRK